MPTTLESAATSYIQSKRLSDGTKDEYSSTIRKWRQWGQGSPIESLNRGELREFLDWVHEKAISDQGENPGRTANKAREHLRAVLSWAWEQDIVEALPRFPKPKEQRDVAGRYYLSKPELNSLYFATYRMKRPRGWRQDTTIGQHWRTALVLFFNYGLDTGTIWKSIPAHEPIRWRHVSWDQQCPDGRTKKRSRYGWLFYRRVKTGKRFYRPMNRVVHDHLRSIAAGHQTPDDVVVAGGGARPNARFRQLCDLAAIGPKVNVETGNETKWNLKDLRKTCATHYDAHMPESSIEILGHSVGGVTYRHYAHRDPLAFKAIMTIPQPTAFLSLTRGFEGMCPCCRRKFEAAN
ncbi:MAG: tyrosine-type recombinase/integrase [Planctomycetaceae bacterium]